MAVRIRLKRTGAKNAASFRAVAADTHFPRDGRFLETLGWYDPKLKDGNFDLKLDRIDYWIAHGAQVSDTVRSLVNKASRQATETIADVAPVESETPAVAEEPETSASASTETVEAVPGDTDGQSDEKPEG